MSEHLTSADLALVNAMGLLLAAPQIVMFQVIASVSNAAVEHTRIIAEIETQQRLRDAEFEHQRKLMEMRR